MGNRGAQLGSVGHRAAMMSCARIRYIRITGFVNGGLIQTSTSSTTCITGGEDLRLHLPSSGFIALASSIQPS